MPARSLRRIGMPLQVGGLLAFLAAILLTVTYGAGRSAAAGVTVTVTPNTGLHNGDAVHVQASGLPPNHASVQVVQCVQGATDSSQCDGNTLDVSSDSDASGNYDNPSYVVHTLSMANHDSINCDASNPCEIYVGVDYNNAFSTSSGTANITFSDSAPTTTSTTTIPTSSSSSSSSTSSTSSTATSSTATSSTTVGGTTTSSVDPNATTTTTAVGGAGGSTDSGSGASVSGSSSSSGGSGSGSTLPLTSAPPLAPWLAGFGLLAFASGTLVRRSALRAAAQAP